MSFLIKIRHFFLLLFLLSLSCSRGESRDDNQNHSKDSVKNDMLPMLRYDTRQFLDFFAVHSISEDWIVWADGLKNLQFRSSTDSSLKALINLDIKTMSKAELVRNFESLSYYLSRARRDLQYRGLPIDNDIIQLIRDLFDGKLEIIKPVRNESTYNRVNTISELLRIASLLNPKEIISPQILKRYPNSSPEAVAAIIFKGIYSQLRQAYNAVYPKSHDDIKNPIVHCAQYRIVAPVMRQDKEWVASVDELKNEILPKFHEMLDDPTSLKGELLYHLTCLEVIEEVLGKSSDPKTGEGLTERYIKFVAKYLWDYPFYGRVCAPFGGVMSMIPANKNLPDDFCKSNSKGVYDNLLLLHIIETYLPGAVIYNSDFAPKSVDVNFAKAKGEKILKELAAMKELKPSPAISPSMSPFLKNTPIGKK